MGIYLEPNVENLGLPSTGGAAPLPDAGSDMTITLPTATVALNGAVDDNDTSVENLTIQWSQVGGPLGLEFADATSSSTMVSFIQPGNYELQLMASDGSQIGVDTIILTVNPDLKVTEDNLLDWQEHYFPGNLRRSAGIFGDPDSDGVNNLHEYLFGGNPIQSDAAETSPCFRKVNPSTYRSYFHRNASNVQYLLAQSSDLKVWQPHSSTLGYDASEEAHYFEVTDNKDRNFFRLEANLIPTNEYPTLSGYRGIWYEIILNNENIARYSGGLGTYTAKHTPLAIYAPEVERTYFVFGGTHRKEENQLLCMIGVYDHTTGKVKKPTIVLEKHGVTDPHDNASISIDEQGYIWVFISGRSVFRPGYIFKSVLPYDIRDFEQVDTREFTYPQPRWIEGQGFVHLFTKYTNGRELYVSRSDDGKTWTADVKLAGMGGHYQSSAVLGDKVGTMFNRHLNGDGNQRSDLYYVETTDRGQTWKDINGQVMTLPLTDPNTTALVHNYSAENRWVYMKGMNWDAEGNLILLYVTSSNALAGLDGNPRRWQVAHWDGSAWKIYTITTSSHNYDMGSIWVEDGLWRVIAPTEIGPQQWGQGGEVAIWESSDAGATWTKVRDVTTGSPRNHGYVRRPLGAQNDFYAFWADGNPDVFSESHLYFCNQDGTEVRKLPYDMVEEWEYPTLE